MSIDEASGPTQTSIDLAHLPSTKDVPLGHSSWLLVDQERIDDFARATGDHQWIHVDPERAANGPFGGTIAHGYLTLGLVPQLLNEIFHVDNRGSGVNYGMDAIRFLSPVPVGSSVRLHGRLVDSEPRRAGVRVRLDLTMDIMGQEKPAMIGRFIVLALP